MSGFTECKKCLQDRIIVPLREDGDSMVCSLCESVYSHRSQKII